MNVTLESFYYPTTGGTGAKLFYEFKKFVPHLFVERKKGVPSKLNILESQYTIKSIYSWEIIFYLRIAVDSIDKAERVLFFPHNTFLYSIKRPFQHISGHIRTVPACNREYDNHFILLAH